MSDPFSVAGSAVGIVSLGITVFDGLYRFYNAWKDAPEEVEEIRGLAEDLLRILQALEPMLQSPCLDAKAVVLVHKMIKPCEDTIYKLQEALSKAKISTRGIKAHARRLQWPFKKQTIDSLGKIMARLQSNLECAMQVLQLAGISKINVKLETLLSVRFEEFDDKILQWLSPLNPHATQDDVLRRSQENTGDWFLWSDEFSNWLIGDATTLWCPGLPGAGKTVMGSLVVECIRQTDYTKDQGLAFLYCSYKETNQSCENLVGSIIQQLARQSSVFTRRIRDLHKEKAQWKARPRLSELESLLHSSVSTIDSPYIIIDALDELRNDDNTRDTLIELLRRLSPHVRLLVTSRPVPAIEKFFRDENSLEIRATREDLEVLVHQYVETRSSLRAVCDSKPELVRTIVDTVEEKAHGMFLLAKLQMDSIGQVDNQRDLLETLDTLPEDLDFMYETALQRFHRQSKIAVARGEQIFTWVSCAQESLRLRALLTALALREDDSTTQGMAVPDENATLSVCGGLVLNDDDDDWNGKGVRLIHYTLEEHFKKKQLYRSPEHHGYIACILITYLRIMIFETDLGALPDGWDGSTLLSKRFPLFNYAYVNWRYHARSCLDADRKDLTHDGKPESTHYISMQWPARSRLHVQDTVLRFLQQLAEVGWRHQLQRFDRDMISSWCSYLDFVNDQPNLLQIAVTLKIESIVDFYLSQGYSATQKDQAGYSALHYALIEHVNYECRDEEDVILKKVLEASGVDISLIDESDGSLLHSTVIKDDAGAFETLMTLGARVSSQDKLVQLVGQSNAYQVLRCYLALEHKDEVRTRLIEKALFMAVENACSDLTDTCLRSDAINDDLKSKALFKVKTEYGLKALLQNGANINITDEFQNRPLHLYAQHWLADSSSTESIDKFLLTAIIYGGADVYSTNNRDQTPLMLAIEVRDNRACKTLLQYCGSTPMHFPDQMQLRSQIDAAWIYDSYHSFTPLVNKIYNMVIKDTNSISDMQRYRITKALLNTLPPVCWEEWSKLDCDPSHENQYTIRSEIKKHPGICWTISIEFSPCQWRVFSGALEHPSKGYYVYDESAKCYGPWTEYKVPRDMRDLKLLRHYLDMNNTDFRRYLGEDLGNLK